MYSRLASVKERKFKYAKLALATTWRTPQKALATVRQTAIANNVFVAIKSFMLKRQGRSIAQMFVSGVQDVARCAENLLSQAKTQMVNSVAKHAITSQHALLVPYVMAAADTRSLRFLQARLELNANMALAGISGCGNIAGSCSKNLAER
jgi:hypothetical protein